MVDVPLVDEPDVVASVVVGVLVEGIALGVVAPGVATGSVAPVEPEVWANDPPMAVMRAAAAAAMVKLLGSLVILILL